MFVRPIFLIFIGNLLCTSLLLAEVKDFNDFLFKFSKDQRTISPYDRDVLHLWIDDLMTVLTETQKIKGMGENDQLKAIDTWTNLRSFVRNPEDLFDFYKKFGESWETECIRKAYRFAKVSFEDPIGQWTDAIHSYENIVSRWPEGEIQNGISKQQALQNQQAIIDAEKKNFRDIMISYGWTDPDDNFKFKAFSCFVDIDWKDDVVQIKYVQQRLVEGATDIRDKNYDMSKLQGDDGVHELRRNLRSYLAWQSGVVRWIDTTPEIRSEYAEFQDEFAGIKDDGEIYESLVSNFMNSGMDQQTAERSAKEFLMKNNPAVLDWQPKAFQLYENLKSSHLLERTLEIIKK